MAYKQVAEQGFGADCVSILIKLFKSLKVHFYFSFIAYDVVNIFKRALTEKYRNAGIEVLRRDILHKIAVISFNGKSVKFEFNKKYEIRYNEQ